MKRTIRMGKGLVPAIRLANRLLANKTIYLSHDYETGLYTISDENPMREHTIVIDKPQPIFKYVKV